MRLGILDKARKGYQIKSVVRPQAGYYGYPHRAEGFDWSREAGLRYDNGIVFAAISWAIKSLCEVDLVHERKVGDAYEEVPNSPIIDLLENPNGWYDYPAMLSGWVISELAGRGGMSWTYKHRSSSGKLVALEYVPHFVVRPWTAPSSGNFLDCWKIATQAGNLDVEPQDMLVQRFGPINPLRPQLSVGPLEAVLMDIGTDKQAASYTATLLRNVGVTPHLISPAMKDLQGVEIEFGQAQADQIEAKWSEKITGENRGRPLVMTLPVNVDALGFSPEDMNLEALRNVSEERVCAALGIPPLVLNLGTGLEQTNNRASAEAAAVAAARSFTLPYMRLKAKQLTRDLIPELGEPGDRIRFRIEDISALMADDTDEAKRDEIACGGPWQTVNEIRERRGLPPIEDGDDLRSGKAQTAKPGANTGQDGPDTTDDEQDNA